MKTFLSDTEARTCPTHFPRPIPGQTIRKGSFFRSSDGQRIPRFQCLQCLRSFSSATSSACVNQKKRKINHALYGLQCSGVSQRRAARILRVNPKTVVRKLRFLAERAREKQRELNSQLSKIAQVQCVDFDDLETSEHTKCKPLSVALAVERGTRRILGFQVSVMPAKGHLTRLSVQKYGVRQDDRPRGWDALFESLVPLVDPHAHFLSDQNPHYPKHLKKYFPHAKHQKVKGRRGCVAGQGELKKGGRDPLFSLNHSCAMLRANLNRLFRKTWCTTKTVQGLIDHLSLYVLYHNTVLLSASTG